MNLGSKAVKSILGSIRHASSCNKKSISDTSKTAANRERAIKEFVAQHPKTFSKSRTKIKYKAKSPTRIISESKSKKNKDDRKIDKQRKGTPRNNQKQNEQSRAVSKKLKLTKKQERILHDRISKRGYTYQEILDEAKHLFK